MDIVSIGDSLSQAGRNLVGRLKFTMSTELDLSQAPTLSQIGINPDQISHPRLNQFPTDRSNLVVDIQSRPTPTFQSRSVIDSRVKRQ